MLHCYNKPRLPIHHCDCVGDERTLNEQAGSVEVEGPGWSAPGVTDRTSRYPLAVETPVLRMVNVLVPGISTLSSSTRHFALYWALAALCGQEGYDASASKTMVNRAEAALAWASLLNRATGELTGPANMHGASTVRRLLASAESRPEPLSELVASSYSGREWGYWAQYKGPALTLGIVTSDKNALRPGARPCPPELRDMFDPLFAIITQRPVCAADLPNLSPLVSDAPTTPDIEPVRGLMTATDGTGRHNPTSWTGDDQTRRSTLRILARAVQLQPNDNTWRARCSGAIASGAHLDTDPVFQHEGARAHAWRGLLLRHRFVGAWRLLRASLVDQVLRAGEPLDRTQLRDWIRNQTSAEALADFVDALPATTGKHGHPLPAEDVVEQGDRGRIDAALAVLLLGSKRITELVGETLAAYRGGAKTPPHAYLDPTWVGERARELHDRRLGDFACALVDDMLDQSHRIALRKLVVKPDGRVDMPSKLYEREGRYFAEGAEGADNIGYREDTLEDIATQLGLFTKHDEGLRVSDIGKQLLELP